MTIEHTLLGAYMLAAGSGLFTGMLVNISMFIFKRAGRSAALDGNP